MYKGYRIAFDVAGSWSFDDDFTKTVIDFGVDNSSSSHSDNRKSVFSVLDDSPTYDINGTFGSGERSRINFTKARTKLCFSLHYSGDNSYLFVN